MAALKYWIWLAEKRGVRRQTKLALTQRFETPEELYYAETDEVLLTEGITREEAAALEDKDLRRAEEILEVCERQDYRILTIADAAYPRRLRNIFDPPILLYCRSGNRSGQAMRLLRQWGRDDVLHLADGFRSWRAAGLPEE